MTALRERARARFEALGFPTSKDEAWRQTPIGPIVRARFEDGPSAPVDAVALEASGLLPPPGARIVFVDGRRSEALTDLASVADGVTVRPLAEAGDGLVGDVADLEAQRPWVQELAAKIAAGTPGAYVGFSIADDPEQVRRIYPGATYDRLAAVKRAYDPDNVFHRNHNVPPTA